MSEGNPSRNENGMTNISRDVRVRRNTRSIEDMTAEHRAYQIRHLFGEIRDRVFTYLQSHFQLGHSWSKPVNTQATQSLDSIVEDPALGTLSPEQKDALQRAVGQAKTTMQTFLQAQHHIYIDAPQDSNRFTLADMLGRGPNSYLSQQKQQISTLIDEILADENLRTLPIEMREGIEETASHLQGRLTRLPTSATFSDIVALNELASSLYDQVDKALPEKPDSMTGLMSYKTFLTQFDWYIEEFLRDGKMDVSLAFIDLNNFKATNDITGNHDLGDEYIRQVAAVLKQNIRGLLCRRGGAADEILIALKGLDIVAASDVLHARAFALIDGSELEDSPESTQPTLRARVEAAFRKKGAVYSSAFDEKGYKISLAAGLTSIRLSLDDQSFYQRFADYLKTAIDSANGNASPTLRSLYQEVLTHKDQTDAPYGIGALINRGLQTDFQRALFRKYMVDMLIDESEKAMYRAKAHAKLSAEQEGSINPASYLMAYNPSMVNQRMVTTRMFKKKE